MKNVFVTWGNQIRNALFDVQTLPKFIAHKTDNDVIT